MKNLSFNLLGGLLTVGVLCSGVLHSGAAEEKAARRVLVVTVTKGFRHSSIATAEKVIGELATKSAGKSHAFTVDYVRNDQEMAEKMTPAALKNYDGFIFANTTGTLPLPDKTAFLNAIKSGKGFVGMHSASDTFHGADGVVDPYIEMLGGEFLTHGAQVGVECLVQDTKHPATKELGESYCVEKEEIYLFKNYAADRVHELLVLDKNPNNKKERWHFPVSWCTKYGEGNVFYTSLGHREDVWENATYQKHILGGIKWALGLEPGDASPNHALMPDEAGFKPLFNGKDLTGWKLRRADGYKSWTVQDGSLINTVNKGDHGTDLVTEEKFRDFTVRYEFKVPDDSNSGFYLRGRHEIQVLGDHKSGKAAITGNGAIYNFKAPDQFASKPGGDWQTVEATMIGDRITVTLNGVKIHDYVECRKPTGSQIDNNVDDPGPIFLQGDHGTVNFRNLRIKILK